MQMEKDKNSPSNTQLVHWHCWVVDWQDIQETKFDSLTADQCFYIVLKYLERGSLL